MSALANLKRCVMREANRSSKNYALRL